MNLLNKIDNELNKLNNKYTRPIFLLALIIGLFCVSFLLCFIGNKDILPIMSFFIACLAILYTIFKSLEREEEVFKDKARITKIKFIALDKGNNNLEARLNKELEDLSKENIIIDVKVLTIKDSKNRRTEAYVVYKNR